MEYLARKMMNGKYLLSLAAYLISSWEAVAFLSSPGLSATLRPQNQSRYYVVLYSSNNSSDYDTNKLLEKARKLREEISAIEASKVEVQKQNDAREQELREAENDVKKQRDEQRLRYSAEVPILKDMGEEVMEKIYFPPRLKDRKSRIVTIQASLPLGLILGEDQAFPGLTSVDEVTADGNGAAAGIKQGDIVRAVTACQTTMETPTWQLMAGGIGQPKTKRFMFSVDGRPLEEVLNAVGSNRMDAQGRDVWIVLERTD